MSVSTPSQGTHFSDGLRTGPIIGSSFVPGANVLTPSVMVSSPIDQQAPGVFNTPMTLLDIIPAPTSVTSIAGAQTLAAAGYVNLVTVNGIGINVITYQGIPNVLQLDSTRNIQIVGSVGVTASTFLVFGWDHYGIPVTEQITGPVGAALVIGNKTFKYIRAIHSSAGTTAPISVGVGDIFGFLYLVTSGNYGFLPSWGGVPDNSWYAKLANNPLTTVNASATVTVAVGSTTGLVNNQFVTITGAAGFNGLSAAQLNITAQITIMDGTHFTYQADGAANAGSTGGGANVSALTIVPGEQSIATATTGDVRGTYCSTNMSGAGPLYSADGASRLTINSYSASGDARNYNAAANGTINLNANPLYSANGFPTVTVFAPNHQLTNGENVTISGATGFGGLAAGAINIGPVPVTIIDQNFFAYTATANATSTAEGGGVIVNMTPRFGNLYQTTAGRFGVAQYNLSPLPSP